MPSTAPTENHNEQNQAQRTLTFLSAAVTIIFWRNCSALNQVHQGQYFWCQMPCFDGNNLRVYAHLG
jgi:hypothetical protein